MQHHVIVSFAKDKEFEFRFEMGGFAAHQSDEARKWFEREFVALECDVATPTGKILAVDRVLSVAKYAGASRFAGDPSWGESFARHAAAILGRDLIRIDIPSYSIGY